MLLSRASAAALTASLSAFGVGDATARSASASAPTPQVAIGPTASNTTPPLSQASLPPAAVTASAPPASVNHSPEQIAITIGIVSMMVLLAQIHKAHTTRGTSCTKGGAGTSTERNYGAPIAAIVATVWRMLNPPPPPEIPEIDLPTFQQFAAELNQFNAANAASPGLCSPKSAAYRSGRAAQYPDQPLHVAFALGWGPFLEQRGFRLHLQPSEIAREHDSPEVERARYSLEIGELARAVVAIEKLIPASYTDKMPPPLRALLRHIELSCEAYALSQEFRDGMWGERAMRNELRDLQSALQCIGRRSYAAELRFLEELLDHRPPLFYDYRKVSRLLVNQELARNRYWVEARDVADALYVVERAVRDTPRTHPVENLATRRMLIALRDAVDLMMVEVSEAYTDQEHEDESGGTALAEQEELPRFIPSDYYSLVDWSEQIDTLWAADALLAKRFPLSHPSDQKNPAPHTNDTPQQGS
ncbi:MAG: hypothetical protein EBZ48_06720 [Proteobacteria bacterium]|nr:hypothetical protein [Pseudomonadota bacterium]